MSKRVIITGGAGFIGSNLVAYLNRIGIHPIVVDDILDESEKWKNLAGLKFELVPISMFYAFEDAYYYDGFSFKKNLRNSDIIVHLAANVDTTTLMSPELWKINVECTTKLIEAARNVGCKIIYASSAAVYGANEENFREDQSGLKPLNPYGFSKLQTDFELEKSGCFGGTDVIGLRFFNVYGPREAHKGNMKSVVSKAILMEEPIKVKKKHAKVGSNNIFYAYSSIDENGYNLFKSDRENIADGEQKRDFVFVDDVCDVIAFFMYHNVNAGIYNVGTGKARSFNELIRAVDKNAEITYVSMPQNLKNQYQYFTQANLDKLRGIGYIKEFTSLEDGVSITKEFYDGTPCGN